eukprot:1166262-Rhodomonas_salina.1
MARGRDGELPESSRVACTASSARRGVVGGGVACTMDDLGRNSEDVSARGRHDGCLTSAIDALSHSVRAVFNTWQHQ